MFSCQASIVFAIEFNAKTNVWQRLWERHTGVPTTATVVSRNSNRTAGWVILSHFKPLSFSVSLWSASASSVVSRTYFFVLSVSCGSFLVCELKAITLSSDTGGCKCEKEQSVLPNKLHFCQWEKEERERVEWVLCPSSSLSKQVFVQLTSCILWCVTCVGKERDREKKKLTALGPRWTLTTVLIDSCPLTKKLG